MGRFDDNMARNPATFGCATAAETKLGDGSKNSVCMERALYEMFSSVVEEREALPPSPVERLTRAVREKDFFLDDEAVWV